MDLSCHGLKWYALPQLYFWCTVCPTGPLHHPRQHKELAQVFFSTLEPITLTPNAVTQSNGVPMFYDTASSSNLPSCTFAWVGMSGQGATHAMLHAREQDSNPAPQLWKLPGSGG